ncbi:cytochrome b (mitochondrion) [Ramazzottius varieornatus]|uniref:Cytochrome b n=1 Tax=Ramazzottius varieornatus TaxID=947166 RepID=A0A1C9ZQ83_RAMVA|nr:cytochrome b [Ramazzottius varieornatus]BAV58171.1 cytochrome b [Ramazzottius varieornatus]
MMNSALVDLPAPSNITHFWNFGSLLGVCLMTQIITGIFLAMHYSSSIDLAFDCISHLMRDVQGGWLMRVIHANGASLFFLAFFIHIGRGLYFKSYVLNMTWISGVTIFLMSMMTAFLGYVLPWGQMSFWGATVITNLLSAVPYIGTPLVEWVWGGFSVNNATLTRFFSLHYLLPFVISLLVIVHLTFLHEQKSSNPLGLRLGSDKITFHPYFSLKDLTSLLLIMFMFMMINYTFPFSLMDAENFIPANPMVTPVHIQPEWYFLFAYAILRAIPNKLGGVMALLLSILMLIPLILQSSMKQFNKENQKNMFFWFFVMIFLILTWLGMKPVEEPFLSMSIVSTFFYFSWFFI